MTVQTEDPKIIRVKKPVKQVREVFISDDQHYHQRIQDGSSEGFSSACRACVKADRNRKPVPRDELANTVFLYGRHFENLAQEYLSRRYPNLDLEHGSALPINQIVSAEDVQIVCVRPLPEVGKPVEPTEIRVRDNVLGKFNLEPNDIGLRLAQMCESEPLKVGDLCFMTNGAAGRIAVSGRHDSTELLKRIHEAFGHCARVQVPAADKLYENLSVGPM